jgi:hypothetical protein
MKKLLSLCMICLLTVSAHTQNTGIGTTTPQATLDVKGNQRIGGASAFMTYDSIGGRIEWRNSNLYVPVSQYLMQHSAAADGLYYNNNAPISGQLEYRNALGNPVFYTNFINGNGYFAGNTGIGTTTPQTKLHIISTGNEVARLDASEPFLSLYSNGAYKGYFWKSPNSIEIGSASGSNLPITLAPDGYQRMFVTPVGNVGIGTGSPLARLHVSDSSVLFSATGDIPATPGNTPISGAGRRMMWYPDKAAFRVGYVPGTQWDKANIGDYSFASGFVTTASGNTSTAMGWGATASGNTSTAIGNVTIASGDISTAMGTSTIASGYVSTAMGGATTASGDLSTAMGNTTIASGNNSTAIGSNSIAKAVGSLSAGVYNDATDNPSPTTNAPTDRIFQIGNGTFSVRSNALTVLRNSNVGIGNSNPAYQLDISSRMRIRSGGNNSSSAGLWLNNNANTEAAFIGMEDDTHVGFYGTGGAGWRFGMNTNNGNIKMMGLVGIGTTSPTSKLHIEENIDNLIGITIKNTNTGSSSAEFLRFDNENGSVAGLQVYDITSSVYPAAMTLFNNRPSGNIRFRTGGLDQMTIANNGNVGIGITSPNAPLAFTNTTGTKISLFESSPNSQYGLAVQGAQLQIYSDNPSAKISFGYFISGVYNERMYLTNSSGILTVNGTNYPSDIRYKKQISTLQHPLKKIMAISGVEYYMRTNEFPEKHFDDKLQTGLIAQEVEKVLPQAVQTGSDGYKSVDYAKVVPLLVEAVKEQQKQINELKTLVQKLLKQ